MKKMLVMVDHYFPKPSPNGICVKEVVKALKKQDIDVTILATNPGYLSEVEVVEGVNVYRIRGRCFTRITGWCDSHKGMKYSDAIRKIAILSNRLKLVLSFPTWPLISPLYTYHYYRKALELHRINNYDGILSVYIPIDPLIAGALVKNRCNNVKLMLYFLDCLSGGVVPRYLTKEWLASRGYKWEKRLFDSADAVFIMQSHKDHYLTKEYNAFKDKIEVVDIPLMRELKLTSDKIDIDFSEEVANIVYAGSMTKRVRDPTYMLETFKLIDKPNQYCLHIYGGGDCHDTIAGYIEEGRGMRVIEHGWVDPDTAIGAMLKSDILVNIGNAVDTLTPSKIFEYMAAGKPIISFYKHDTEPSIQYLRQYPLSLLIKEDWTELHENARLVANFIDVHNGMLMAKLQWA